MLILMLTWLCEDNDVNGVVLLDMTLELLDEIGVPHDSHGQLLQVCVRWCVWICVWCVCVGMCVVCVCVGVGGDVCVVMCEVVCGVCMCGCVGMCVVCVYVGGVCICGCVW